jgi:WD40 repeat protein
VVFSPDGQTLASAAGCFDLNHPGGNFTLWRVRDGAAIWAMTTMYSINSVAFSPDGARLAAGGVSGISLWDVGAPAVPAGTSGKH